jgi:hypothetical protein
MASFFAQVFTATLENLNFFFLPFSSIVTKPILVTLSVKGQISITLEASIGFSNLTICPGVVHIFLTCLVTIFTSFTTILFFSFKTLTTSALVFLSFHESTSTLSQVLIFISID